MSLTNITRRLEIDAAHRVPDHGSKCFNMHGHRYVIEAVVQGPVIRKGQQNGMVMDFGFLKECMQVAIYDPCDHASIFFYDDPILLEILGDDWDRTVEMQYPVRIVTDGWKLVIVDAVPTAENLACLWAGEIQTQIDLWFREQMIDEAPKVLRVHVWETPNCVATYETGVL